jgi:hypothetical protein
MDDYRELFTVNVAIVVRIKEIKCLLETFLACHIDQAVSVSRKGLGGTAFGT